MAAKIHPHLLLGTEDRPRKLTTQQIGRLGELLVQFELLRCGIESAPMTTDTGVDLVAYSAISGRSFTIQVKASLKPKPGGGKGALAIGWWVSEDCPAQLYALVELSTCRIWLLTKRELAAAAQQHPLGRFHVYMYTDSETKSRTPVRNRDTHFSKFLLENRVSTLFC
jgi:hypothetical protein